MAGLVPAIHAFTEIKKDVDARDKRGHDEQTKGNNNVARLVGRERTEDRAAIRAACAEARGCRNGRRRHRPRRNPARRRARQRRRQGDDQLPRRREPAPAAQIPLGVGEVSRRLQQSLDAHGSLHAGRHRALEVATASPRTSAARSSAISASSRRRSRSSQTTSCLRSTAI